MSRCLRSLIGQLSLLLVPNMVLSKMNNHEHRTKQTYESYTFQPLMSFWCNIIIITSNNQGYEVRVTTIEGQNAFAPSLCFV